MSDFNETFWTHFPKILKYKISWQQRTSDKREVESPTLPRPRLLEAHSQTCLQFDNHTPPLCHSKAKRCNLHPLAESNFNHLHLKFKSNFTSKLDLNLRKKLIKCYIWSMALYCAETWTLRAVDQKYLESFEMWCWRRMEKISWTDHVRNEEVLLRVNEQRNILHEIRKRKANWIGHVLYRNCLLKQVIEGKIKGEMEVARRRGR